MTDNLDNPIADIEEILDRDDATEDRLVKASGLLYPEVYEEVREPKEHWFVRMWNLCKDIL